MSEALKSVIFREGPIGRADYLEAISLLHAAIKQPELAHWGCSVCEDSGHTAESCCHNPLVAARKWARATAVWACYHCGFVATNDEEAQDHFGKSDLETAKCQRERN